MIRLLEILFGADKSRHENKWSWVPLEPFHVKNAVRVDHTYGKIYFSCVVKEVRPRLYIELPTERRSNGRTAHHVEIHGARYFIDPVSRSVAVLPVVIAMGEGETGGEFFLRSKEDRDGILASCRVNLSHVDFHVYASVLHEMLRATVPPPSACYLYPEKRVVFQCAAAINKQSDSSEGLTGTLRDATFEIDQGDDDNFGASAFIAKNDFGFINSSDLLRLAIQLNPKGL